MHFWGYGTLNLWVRGPSKVKYREARAYQLLHPCLNRPSYCNYLLSSLSPHTHSLDFAKLCFCCYYYFYQKTTCDVKLFSTFVGSSTRHCWSSKLRFRSRDRKYCTLLFCLFFSISLHFCKHDFDSLAFLFFVIIVTFVHLISPFFGVSLA